MTRYILKRLLLALVTLWLLVTAVYFMVNVLPQSVAKSVLGNTALPEAVDRFNLKWKLNDPQLTQYFRYIKGLVHFDLGRSYKSERPVLNVLGGPLVRSAKLAIFALVITVPISIWAGVTAARRRDGKLDRAIVLTGLATSSIPEFVTGALLVIVFGVFLNWLPVISTIPSGTSLIGQVRYLILPALSMAIVYFGYIARMMRAGSIKALESDYARTATMKGLNDRQLIRRHVIRNAIPPTITVISVQIGYLFGGIIAVEKVFNYSGIGQQIFVAVSAKDLPLLQGCVLIVGTIYMLATLTADIIIAWLNPRVRLQVGSS
ncbi:MAG TPA: ABC transporter permease [Ilumatobacteraceae bacterium]|nr:ABC transporter permease [Ilumatobacteraceae bacterium]